ncbi:MAG: TIGR00730 family Rossman fold protein [Paludibacteraceae bacterium]|nr:TIGR00730 family Rossman fold protein [Paludibacteraceae bacterium]
MNVAVYCSAKDCIPEDYLRLGDELGEWLALNGYSLVYGGATGGLMSRVSDSYRKAADLGGVTAERRGRIIGVVPNRIIHSRRKAQNCDVLFVVGTMAERKQKMRDLADCFVCLPGSYGTLDEMCDVISSGTVGEHRKPLFVVNYERFYDGLLTESEHMHSLKFLPEQEIYAPVYVEKLNDLYECLKSITN